MGGCLHLYRPIATEVPVGLNRAPTGEQSPPTHLVSWHVLLALSVLLTPQLRGATDPEALLKEADRLAELGNLNRA